MRQQITINARGNNVMDGRQVRAMAFVPARRQLLDRLEAERGLAGSGRRALVVGGGYSPIPADLHGRGFAVTAVDPSPAATEFARADTPGVTFRAAPPTDLGVDSGGFDLVYAADTLEVSDDLDAVVDQLANAVRPGGTLVLDTVADTVVARLIYLFAFPLMPFVRFMPRGRYTSSRLHSTRELEEACRRAGLRPDYLVGFEPRSIGALVRAVLDRRSGRISDEGLPAAAGFHLSDDGHAPVVTYFAVATRNSLPG